MSNAVSRWWRSLDVYANPKVRALLFLGFSSGLPFALVLTTLSARLRQAGIDRSTIGYFSLVGLAYSLKFFWSPVVDRVRWPLLSALGQRRSWMLVAQAGIVAGLTLLALADPASDAVRVAWLAVFTAFCSATQDIAVDAYRIEAADERDQGAMAAAYQIGYQVALIVAGAGALTAAAGYGWQTSYFVMAACGLVGVATTLLIAEPEATLGRAAKAAVDPAQVQAAIARMRASVLVVAVAATALAGALLGAALPADSRLALEVSFGAILLVEIVLLALLKIAALRPALERLVASTVLPLEDFFQRYGTRTALMILLLIVTYRLNYTTMGVAANTFYLDMGFSLEQIALVSKVYGIGMTMLGAVFAGVLIRRIGVAKTMLLGVVALSVANLLYAHMASIRPGVAWLAVVVSADNVANGIAGTAFIAFMSSLTSAKFTATQYALFGTLWSLPAKSIASQWGKIVDAWGYPAFFIYTAAIALPSVLLVLWLIRHQRRTDAASAQAG